MSERRREHQEGPDQQEHKRAPLVHLPVWYSVSVHADRVIPAKEDYHSHEGIPGQFDNDVGCDKDLPRECLGRAFANFVQGPLHNEMWHGLLDDVTENGHEHEDGKELVL